jgi:hypothetical protein
VLARNALVLSVKLLSPKLNAVIVQKPGKMHNWHHTIRVVPSQLSHGISESACCLSIGRHSRKHGSFDFMVAILIGLRSGTMGSPSTHENLGSAKLRELHLGRLAHIVLVR